MTAYLLGYILFAVIVLLLVNMAFRSKKRKQQSEPAAAETAEAPVLTEARATTDDDKSEKAVEADAPYEPIPELKEDFKEAMLEAEGMSPAEAKVVAHNQDATKEERAQAIAQVAQPQPEAQVAEATEKKEKQPQIHVGRILTVLLLGAFVAILNQTLINVAIPHMMNDLNESANTIQWLTTGYMLVNGVLIPITAFLIERFGTRKLFLTAMILFTAGALICAFAPTFPIILTGRLIQAAGAGIIMPLMMTVFLTVFPPEKRGAAMGTMGIAMIFAPAIGPTLSGWIVQNYSWRLLFWVVIPIGILDLILASAWLADVTKRRHVKFDFWGFLFSTLGFGGLLYAFSEAGTDGWSSATVLSWTFVGVVSLVLFVWREITAKEPMLDLRVFKYEIFTLTTIISSVINMAMFAAMILLPIYLQNIRGFTPLQSGLLLLPGAIIMGIMQPIAGAIFDKIGARILAVIGLIITTVTTYQFAKLTADTTYGHILLLYCLRMFGMSFMMMTIMTAGMNQLPRVLHAHGTATSNTLRQVAGSLGTALLVTVMSTRANFHAASAANTVSSANPYILSHVQGMGQGLAAMAGLPQGAGTPLMQYLLYGMVMKQSTIDGINDAFLIATGITVIALILSFFIKHVKPNTDTKIR